MRHTGALGRLDCFEAVAYGRVAYTGYNPSSFLKCGYSNAPGGGSYRRYRGCPPPSDAADPEQGQRLNGTIPAGLAHPQFPFVTGPIEVLSAPVVLALARSRDVRAFAEAADRGSAATHFLPAGDEDAALGYWLSRLHLSGELNISYVDERKVFNMGCRLRNALYRPPSNHTVAVHFLKTRGGMEYVWRLLHHFMPHDERLCSKMTGDWRL